MLRTELLEILRNGEGSTVEFKRDDIAPQDAAKAMVALANARGGRLLMGVEDDGTVSGVTRPDIEEWVLTIGQDKVRPPLVPIVERVNDVGSGKDVLAVAIDAGYAVHARWHNGGLTYYVRVGRQSREASTEELARLQQQRGDVRTELRPVPGLPAASLDRHRLSHYFADVRGQSVPTDEESWERLLVNTE
ncbi:MAG: helix-turn-helix domain-containing protein [Kineosporiaceae bacterium]